MTARGKHALRLHQPGRRAAGGGVAAAMGLRQVGFRAHLDQSRRGALEFVGLIAVGLGKGRSHQRRASRAVFRCGKAESIAAGKQGTAGFFGKGVSCEKNATGERSRWEGKTGAANPAAWGYTSRHSLPGFCKAGAPHRADMAQRASPTVQKREDADRSLGLNPTWNQSLSTMRSARP